MFLSKLTKYLKVKASEFDAVVLVDMQEGFVSHLRKGAAQPLIDCQSLILQECITSNTPVAVLEHNYDDTKTVQVLSEIVMEIPRNVIIRKNTDDGFARTDLDKTLRGWRAKKLLITGINGSYCVKSTARSALDLKYEILTSPRLISGLSGQSWHDPTDSIDWFEKHGTIIGDIPT